MCQADLSFARAFLVKWIGCFFFGGVTGELSTLCQVAKVPNEPSLRQNNGSETMCPSDQSMASVPQTGQAKRLRAMTTSRGSKAGHVMTQMDRLGTFGLDPDLCVLPVFAGFKLNLLGSVMTLPTRVCA